MAQGQVYKEEQAKLPQLGIYLENGASKPTRGTDKSTCYDIKATSVKYDEDKGYLVYGTGIFLDIPEGYEVELFMRSSVRDYDLFLCNGVGKIDEDYKKELFFTFKPTYDFESAKFNEETGELKCWRDGIAAPCYPTIYSVGERVGQMEMKKKDQYELASLSTKPQSDRGGHGSTGK